jgi:hypothetical protein
VCRRSAVVARRAAVGTRGAAVTGASTAASCPADRCVLTMRSTRAARTAARRLDRRTRLRDAELLVTGITVATVRARFACGRMGVAREGACGEHDDGEQTRPKCRHLARAVTHHCTLSSCWRIRSASAALGRNAR